MSEINQANAEVKTAQCDNCGGHLEFDAQTQHMKCPFCGSVHTIEATRENVKEIDLSDMSKFDFNWNVQKKVVVCEQCGGQTITDPTDETAYCSFCASQHIIVRDDNDMGMKPQGILPYALTQDQAREHLKKWISRRYLAPGDLKNRYLNKNLKGIYIPFWTFDANTHTNYSCEVGTYYYTGTGDKRQRHTKWRNHFGNYDRLFDDHLICGIAHDYQKYIKRVEPYNMNAVVDYAPHYLAGYQAQKYVLMPEQAYQQAKSEMQGVIRSSVIGGLPGDTHRNYNQRTTFSNVTFKHILLPLYMMTYTYNQKIFNVMINGQTGEVQGQSPLSPIKVGALVLLAIIVIAIVLTFGNS